MILLTEIAKRQAQLTQWRHELHQIPEIAFNEHQTMLNRN